MSVFLGALVTGHVISITLAHDWIVGISGGVAGFFGYSLITNRRSPWWTTLAHRPLHAVYLFFLTAPLLPTLAEYVPFRIAHFNHLGGLLYGLAAGIALLGACIKPLPHALVTALPVLLVASQLYSPWQSEWRLVRYGPELSSPAADCRLRTAVGEEPVSVRFTNETDRIVAGYWLDHEGQAQFYFSLLPGDKVDYNSFLTHAWCIVDMQNRQAIAAFVVNRPDQDFIIR